MTEPTDKCGNPACHCPAEMGTGYCCEGCEAAELEQEIRCHCDHPECAEGKTRQF